MLVFEALAEQRILAALEAGEFDHLPGAGRPLELEDDSLVPEELRMAYRILKNAGLVPPEIEALREIGELERLVQSDEGETKRYRALDRLNFLLSRTKGGHKASDLRVEAHYLQRILERLGRYGESPEPPSY